MDMYFETEGVIILFLDIFNQCSETPVSMTFIFINGDDPSSFIKCSFNISTLIYSRNSIN